MYPFSYGAYDLVGETDIKQTQIHTKLLPGGNSTESTEEVQGQKDQSQSSSWPFQGKGI